jgi:hypothetical protein
VIILWDTRSQRGEYAHLLERYFQVGEITREEIIMRLANYDALQATKRMGILSFASTIAGAASAIAAAFAAYFAYLAIHR